MAGHLASTFGRAVARQEAETAVATLAAAWMVLERRGPFMVGGELAASVLDLPLPSAQAARARCIRGQALRSSGRAGEARACNEAALDTLRGVGGRRNERYVLAALGRLHAEQGRRDEARAAFDEGERLLREVRDCFGLIPVLCDRAHLDHSEGLHDAAAAALAEAESLAAQAGAGPDSECGEHLAKTRAVLDGDAS